MRQMTIHISCDEEKLSALKLYLDRKGIQIEDELVKTLDALYEKNVPAGVREFIDLRAGNTDSPAKKMPRSKADHKNVSEVTKHESR